MTLTRRKALGLVVGLLLPFLANGAARDITTKIIKWNRGSHAFVVRSRREKYSAQIVSARDITGNDVASTQEIQERTGAYAVFNCRNRGLYMHQGRIINPFVREKSDGLLYTNKGGQVNIVGDTALSAFMPIMVDAIQVDLLSAGNVKFYNPYGNTRTSITLVGLSDSGLVAAVFKDVTYTIGDELMRDYGCKIVANLDSGSSSSAYDKFGRSSFRRGDSLEERVPNFLVMHD